MTINEGYRGARRSRRPRVDQQLADLVDRALDEDVGDGHGIVERARDGVGRSSRARGPRVLDTRATTPGMRWLEKQAVVAGGGVSHRAGLHAILIKENHIALACGVSEAVRRAHAAQPDLDVSVGALTHSAPVLDVSQLIEGL